MISRARTLLSASQCQTHQKNLEPSLTNTYLTPKTGASAPELRSGSSSYASGRCPALMRLPLVGPGAPSTFGARIYHWRFHFFISCGCYVSFRWAHAFHPSVPAPGSAFAAPDLNLDASALYVGVPAFPFGFSLSDHLTAPTSLILVLLLPCVRDKRRGNMHAIPLPPLSWLLQAQHLPTYSALVIHDSFRHALYVTLPLNPPGNKATSRASCKCDRLLSLLAAQRVRFVVPMKASFRIPMSGQELVLLLLCRRKKSKATR